MTNSQIYSVFLIRGNTTDNALFLFKFKQSPNLRPSLGDVLTSPLTFEQFKIIRDESTGSDPDIVTHQYFVTPANNPNRISSYGTAGFANDQTLRQLFR